MPSPKGRYARPRWPDEKELVDAEGEVKTKIGKRLENLSDIGLALLIEAAEVELKERGSSYAPRGHRRSPLRRR